MLKTLYVHRPVLNWQDIAKWAKEQGFASTVGEDMHVTLAFSKTPFDVSTLDPETDTLKSKKGVRAVKPLGDAGATVLHFVDERLHWRWQAIKDAGAEWDFDGYQPHITITYDPGDVDISSIEPYSGKIQLGPEQFSEVNNDWKDEIIEDPVITRISSSEIMKVSMELGVVFGFAIVCMKDGKEYYDLENHHIPEETMLKAALKFSLNSNIALDMHGDGDFGDQTVGVYPFLFPLTTEIAKSMGIKSKRTGLIVGFYPSEKSILNKFKTGEYTGFSIGGFEMEEV